MALEDEEFDILAGSDNEDEGAADAVADLDTETEEQVDVTDDGPAVDQGDTEEEAPAETEEQTEQQEQSGGQTVPLAVLLEERKSYQSRMDDLAAKAAKFEAWEEKMREIQARKEAEKPEEPEPEYLDDPKAYVDHKLTKAEQKAAEADSKVTQLREATEQQQQMQQINNRLGTFDTEFAKQSPDYYDALEHVRAINIENIKSMGADEQQAATQAAQAMFMAQAQAMHKGINPAEYMYNMAKRFGYAPKADDAEDTKDTQDAKDDAIIAGQDAASMGGGAAPDSERDEELDDDEFSEAFSELFGQAPR
mgnify:CR=1 FL=1